MKTQETNAAQMDDIVFERRNKSYGAYILRKTYNKQVNKALLLATAILIAGLAYPVVSSYNLLEGSKPVWIDPGVVVLTTEKPLDKVIPPLPPAPPDVKIQKQAVFTAPEVVAGEVPDFEGLLNMDDANQTSNNVLLDLPAEKPVEKPVVIEDPETSPPSIFVQEMPEFPGGDAERQKFLADNIIYPTQATDNGIQGTVYIQFIVNSKGDITDAKILRGIGGGCDEEALRVVMAMPQWHPGKQNGKAVRVIYNMSVIFSIK